ncbi:MAG: sigma-54 dependent transcriptional regulator [Candidatus Cloacimonetes bacterium]|nr:sigma-54 dependent transcriptional regulator [Candidatus Cloacimonadota bacterium]
MNILIVDDEQNICVSLQNILEDEGYNCHALQDPLKSLEYITNQIPDIVLLDVSMPHIGGLEVLEKIKNIDSGIQVIMISGHSGISEAVKAIKLGAFDFLEKPLSLPKVKLTVRKAYEFRSISQENERLKSNFSENFKLIGKSAELKELKKVIDRVAPTNSKVLIRGESGTGKELIAYAIHNQSHRSNNPFIKFNSAAIPNELVESELFGFEKGAFTGAVKSKKGKLAEADGGTLFLDEIGDMSLSAQAKILRVIQEGEFEKVGSNKKEKIDTRVIAATHKNLEEMVKTGHFREDLFFRLNVIPIISPPLRSHPEDIPVLIEHFSKMFHSEMKVPLKTFTDEAILEMQSWLYPGNVRELKNLIERFYILIDNQEITPQLLARYNLKDPYHNNISEQHSELSFWKETVYFQEKKREFEIKYLTEQLKKHNYNITQTSHALGIHQSNLSRKLKELNISFS